MHLFSLMQMTTWVVRIWWFKSPGTKKPTRFFLAIVFSIFLVFFYNLSHLFAFFTRLFIVLYPQSCFIISNFFHAAVIVLYYHKHTMAVIVLYYHKHTMEVSECFKHDIFIWISLFFQAHTKVYSGFRTTIFFLKLQSPMIINLNTYFHTNGIRNTQNLVKVGSIA
jgi:hypothetical protein